MVNNSYYNKILDFPNFYDDYLQCSISVENNSIIIKDKNGNMVDEFTTQIKQRKKAEEEKMIAEKAKEIAEKFAKQAEEARKEAQETAKKEAEARKEAQETAKKEAEARKKAEKTKSEVEKKMLTLEEENKRMLFELQELRNLAKKEIEL
ncbi:MAG: hypothetical protein EAZ44_11245 [Cytophagia bacterium]|nr:MAG: hypothetical protein EAZ44_11245 [Cytophagia bacterium]TAG46683.1 MAG: hypothetical protein EAZ31_00080 [Cytophagia bacterium]